MEKQTVKELKVLAKERGIKGYYRLRKAELIKALSTDESEIYYSARMNRLYRRLIYRFQHQRKNAHMIE